MGCFTWNSAYNLSTMTLDLDPTSIHTPKSYRLGETVNCRKIRVTKELQCVYRGLITKIGRWTNLLCTYNYQEHSGILLLFQLFPTPKPEALSNLEGVASPKVCLPKEATCLGLLVMSS